MVQDNVQNTYSGGGEPIVAPTGNAFLDLLGGLANVGVKGLDVYEDIQDRRAARDIERMNAAKAPIQDKTPSRITSISDDLSNPRSIQAMAFYGIGFIVIGGLTIWALQKL